MTPKPDQARVERSEAELQDKLAAKADRSTMAQAENMVEDIAALQAAQKQLVEKEAVQRHMD